MGSTGAVRFQERRTPSLLYGFQKVERHDGEGYVSPTPYGQLHQFTRRRPVFYDA